MIKPFGSCLLFFYKKITELLFCDLLKWHKHSHGASEEDDGRLISCCRRCWRPIYVDNDFKLIGECEDEEIKKSYKIVMDRYLDTERPVSPAANCEARRVDK